jgi:RNA polymerase sigma-70 factor, ECF subfamily
MDGFVTIRLPALMTPKREEAAPEEPGALGTDVAVSDEALLARIGAGEQDALALLFRRYAGLVRRIAYRVLRDASEADDMLQDVFLLIHRNSSRFDSAKSPAHFWILQMTYRSAISRRRYLNSRHFYTRLDLDQAAEDLSAPAERRGFEDPITEALGSGALERMFQSLSENQQRTLRLFFLEGYTLDEIASELDQSRANVRHHYFRGLEKLRKQIFAGSSRG